MSVLRQEIAQRELVIALTRQILRSRHVGTAGGVLWCFAQPVAMVAIYWLVFSVGFKARGPAGEPFILFFVTGLAPWLFFNDAVTGSIGSVVANPHLVKKIVFPTELLPLAHVLSAAVIHVVVVAITLVVMAVYRVPFGVTILGTVYYFVAVATLALGLGWLVAGLQVLFRDVGQIVTVLLGFWFWLTPVVWPPSLLPPEFGVWMALNPLSYVAQGYRDCLLHGVWPAAQPIAGLIFWGEALVLLGVGAALFRRLKPGFAEAI